LGRRVHGNVVVFKKVAIQKLSQSPLSPLAATGLGDAAGVGRGAELVAKAGRLSAIAAGLLRGFATADGLGLAGPLGRMAGRLRVAATGCSVVDAMRNTCTTWARRVAWSFKLSAAAALSSTSAAFCCVI
jgi:hypothetical protein